MYTYTYTKRSQVAVSSIVTKALVVVLQQYSKSAVESRPRTERFILPLERVHSRIVVPFMSGGPGDMVNMLSSCWFQCSSVLHKTNNATTQLLLVFY